jgi:hypothetical protein
MERAILALYGERAGHMVWTPMTMRFYCGRFPRSSCSGELGHHLRFFIDQSSNNYDGSMGLIELRGAEKSWELGGRKMISKMEQYSLDIPSFYIQILNISFRADLLRNTH